MVRRLDEVAASLDDLGEVLAAEEDLGRVLQRSVDQVTTSVPGADMASVSVLRGDSAETIASSSEQVWAIDSDQYAAGDGPCLEAARTGHVVRVGMQEAQRRWPQFARSARAAAIESYLSCPLMIDEEFAGSLNLYSEQPHGFADFDVALLRLHVTVACAAIAGDRRSADARRVARQLTEALESRAVIDQAVGMLMAWTGSSAEQAFAHGRRYFCRIHTETGFVEEQERPL